MAKLSRDRGGQPPADAATAVPGAAGVLSGLQAAGGDTARYALDNKLVDELASRTAIENQLVKAFGWDKQANDFNATSIYDYQPKPDANRGGKIAVVFANGAIMDGPQTPGNVGAIPPPPSCAARPDPAIKAVVFRVNSPGGSVSASEVIRSELAAVRAAGKPVVVSMGGMARRAATGFRRRPTTSSPARAP